LREVAMTSLAKFIDETLTRELRPQTLTVTDESDQHAGHAGHRPGGQTHFRVDVVSDGFTGKSRIERHRLVNALLAEAFERGLHALAIKARAPGE
jgi:BolA protein